MSSILKTGKQCQGVEINSWLVELVLCLQRHKGKKQLLDGQDCLLRPRILLPNTPTHNRGCFWKGRGNGQQDVYVLTFYFPYFHILQVECIHVFLDFLVLQRS